MPPPPPRVFPESEFVARLQRAQRAMAAAELDLLLITTEADLFWFSGFLSDFWQSPTRPWFLVVPATGKPVAVIPSIGLDCMRRTWLDDIRTWSSPAPQDDGVSLLVDALEELGGARARVGIASGPGTHVRMPLDDLERVRERLPGARWQDTTALLQSLRAIKSALEVERIRHVCKAASDAFDALPSRLEPGMDDVEVFRAFRIACLDAGVDDVAYLVGAAGPGGYGDIISPPSGRPLRRGDMLILDAGCRFAGYFCDFDRNWALGDADAPSADAYRIAWEATEAGLEAVRPGVTCHAVFEAMQAVMAPHAIQHGGRVGRLGHGLGIQLTEPPSLMAGEGSVLQAGMVMTLEPGFAYAPDRVMVHEENVLVTETGCELLSRRAASTLPVIEW